MTERWKTMKFKCFKHHVFETTGTESHYPKCPTCGAMSHSIIDDNETSSTSALEDLAIIDSILAESSAVESASVPDAGGFSGFDGGDSGGAGASDSFDSGGVSSDSGSV